jgi:hypothetical protein
MLVVKDRANIKVGRPVYAGTIFNPNSSIYSIADVGVTVGLQPTSCH